jgi:rhomboid family GlyGly-CTERM serine protease
VSPLPLPLPLPGRTWLVMCVLMAKASLIAFWLPSTWLDWQPTLAWREPWRALSAAFVHWSSTHLVANLLGAAVLALLGLAMKAPTRLTLAWCAAWPLTHLGLLLQPQLAHYGGLSGVMHAGLAAASVWLVLTERGRRWLIGLGLLIGLVVKLWLEQPWGEPLRHGAGWDIAIAPLVHSTGAIAGAACALLAWASSRVGSWQSWQPRA